MSAASASAAATTPPNAELEQFACHRSSVALSRTISVIAVMRARPGLPRLELAFVLERKRPRSGRFVAVREGDLGKWILPGDPTLGTRPTDMWKLQKPVVNLAAPAVYRFEVHFRWIGQRQSSATTLFSRRCVQTR